MLRTGSSFNAALCLKEYFTRTLKAPTIIGMVVLGALNVPTFKPNTIAKAGVRAVASNPLFKFVTYYSLFSKGAIVGSIVYNQLRSWP